MRAVLRAQRQQGEADEDRCPRWPRLGPRQCCAQIAWLPDAGAEEILATPRLVLAPSFNPQRGGAVAVDGGYRLTARWRFSSGCQDAAWFLLLTG